MNKHVLISLILLIVGQFLFAQSVIYQSQNFSIYPNRVIQGHFTAKALSAEELQSDYQSLSTSFISPRISFKFSINGLDNEMLAGTNHELVCVSKNGTCVSPIIRFGERFVDSESLPAGTYLKPNTNLKLRLDMRRVFAEFNKYGFYTNYKGEKIYKADFKGVYVAGSVRPLAWNFDNLVTKHEFRLLDKDGDGIFEIEMKINPSIERESSFGTWKLGRDISSFPQYKSEFPISDAIYNLATEEMIKAVEPDSTFRTGKEWAGVWTRDISYSIILSMAHLQPKVAKYSLLRKVKNGRIIQDTGTGGAYPISTDRVVWAIAAWELYKVTGDKDWLMQAYTIIRNSVEDDLRNVLDKETGLVKGESSFLDWREQTYPRWMTPVDIYESQNLGTNAVHFQANIILAKMARLLNDNLSAEKYQTIAAGIKQGINQQLWLEDKGYYGQYVYGRNSKIVSPRAEALGEALCVWFGIADSERQKQIVSNTPVTDFGIPCIYPQIPNIPAYHNDAVWPFVQSYWCLASAKTGNEKSVMECIGAIYRPAALFLTNKENFVSTNGDYAGTQINSSNMLWSLSGSLAIVQKVLFGIDFGTDSLYLHPFVPEALAGKRTLTNFKCRTASLDIEMDGFGSKIADIELDGIRISKPAIPYSLVGRHTLKVTLTNQKSVNSKIKKVENKTSPDNPIVRMEKGKLTWNPIAVAKLYQVLQNGKLFKQTNNTFLKIPSGSYAEYQVLAIDEYGISSFASEPIVVCRPNDMQTIEIENFASQSLLNYKNYQGKGFVEISKTVNRTLKIPINVNQSGLYTLSFRYANGNGPINTENKCAIRALYVDSRLSGTIVFPQRGKDEWSNWGNSNSVKLAMGKGKHEVELVFEPQNENMNGEINQAMLDALMVTRLK